jgi:hypothetical protein
MTAWQITALPEHRLTLAWPLVRLRYPDWTLETWLAEARTLLADEGIAGVLAVQNDAGYIYAVCGYQIDGGEHGHAELALRTIANVGWCGSADPLSPLLCEVEAIAREHGCVSSRLDGAAVAAAGETARWERLGYCWTGADLRKEFGSART